MPTDYWMCSLGKLPELAPSQGGHVVGDEGEFPDHWFYLDRTIISHVSTRRPDSFVVFPSHWFNLNSMGLTNKSHPAPVLRARSE